MKQLNYSLALMVTCLFWLSCEPAIKVDITETPEEQPLEMSYDSALAQKLGADEYGMHQYVMAILKSGPNKPPSRQVSDSLFRGHMDNIQRLAEEGKLVLAGPFLADSNFRGIYIFDVKTVEEAQALTNTDPAIQYGSLVMELKPWYGSAALKEVNGLHKRVAQKEV